jgi:hypothetical protein
MHFEEGRNSFTVSVDCPFESFSSNRLLQPGEELNVYFDPPPEEPVTTSIQKKAVDETDGENEPAEEKSGGEDPAAEKSDDDEHPAAEKPDGGDGPAAKPQQNLRPAWRAVVLDNDNIYHPGSLLLQVQRPHATRGRDRPSLDDRVIPSGPKYALDLADVDIYSTPRRAPPPSRLVSMPSTSFPTNGLMLNPAAADVVVALVTTTRISRTFKINWEVTTNSKVIWRPCRYIQKTPSPASISETRCQFSCATACL